MENLKNETATVPAIFVGQVLYREKSIRNGPSEIQEVTVSKIGKKYFYLTGAGEQFPINIKTLEFTDKIYSQFNFKLYRSKQEILDIKEKSVLRYKLQQHFNLFGNCSKNTLEQLRQAVEVLGIT